MYSNEEYAVMIQQGKTSYKPVLWHNVEKFLYMLSFRYYARNTNWCLRHGLDADDLKQQSYIAFERSFKGYDVKRGLYITWLGFMFKVAARELIRPGDVLNNENTLSIDSTPESESGDYTPLAERVPDQSAAEPFERISADGVRETVRAAVDTLPEQQRDIITHVYFKGGTLRAAAAHAGVSAQCLSLRMRDGLNSLQKNPDIKRLADDFGYNSHKAQHNGLRSFMRRGITGVELVAIHRADALRYAEPLPIGEPDADFFKNVYSSTQNELFMERKKLT